MNLTPFFRILRDPEILQFHSELAALAINCRSLASDKIAWVTGAKFTGYILTPAAGDIDGKGTEAIKQN
jgi:hypothetical protein